MRMQNEDFHAERPRPGDVRITRRVELNFWRTCLLNAAGLLLADITTSSDQLCFGDIWSFSLLIVTIWFLNWIIKPVLVVFTLPFIIFTMGIGMMFINAIIIYLAARILPFDGIMVSSYWVALWASFWVSFLWWALEMFRAERIATFKFRGRVSREEDQQKKDDDVIDI